MRHSGWILAAAVLLTLGAGFVGSQFIPGEWYRNLVKPSFTPPSGVIGPVWGFLYLTMIVAFWRVWRQPRSALVRRAFVLYGLNLVLNGLWSFLFFGLEWPLAAFVEVTGLWLVLLATVMAFGRVERVAGWLLVPYLGWVGFDVVWHLFLWRLNR